MASSVIREKTPSPRRWRAIRTVVTWNGVGFDFDVLAAEAQMLAECRALALAYVDIMFNVVCRLGYGVAESTPA
jgi:hypothetical protein